MRSANQHVKMPYPNLHSKSHTSSREEIEIDLDDILLSNGFVEEYMYIEDVRARKLYLNGPVCVESVSAIIRNILKYNLEDKDIPVEKRKPITLFVSSVGGSVDDGFALIDTIMNSKTPVKTVNTGYMYSMAFLIGLAGHERYTMPNAKFLVHDGNYFVYNSTMKAQDQMRFQEKIEDRIRDYVCARTTITPEEYNSKLRVEWYMFADEAKDKGVSDYIIGEDCSIYHIL